ncbi:Ecm13p Ecym_7173 [Eremothecium cymbalariae DBVPG|uniref:Uncharacterized protein n=1 Tax=Eremothecium cymbalariae (strain CBS 270.75 / DBVPG 7215 / KCTC 17166 / NRRL Y-17582) TaxID=931890 RepID=G8JW06_ERECY|nr:hypothetical protein Ecym_7173 [Eremothecium cymbalariae DBVPG\
MKQLTPSEQYILANKARSKLLFAAQCKGRDYDLRVLVGHANLLDRVTEALGNRKIFVSAAHSTDDTQAYEVEHCEKDSGFDSDSDSEFGSSSESDSESDAESEFRNGEFHKQQGDNAECADTDYLYYYACSSEEEEEENSTNTAPYHYIYQSYNDTLKLSQLNLSEPQHVLEDANSITRVSSTEIDEDDDRFSEDEGLFSLRPIYV